MGFLDVLENNAPFVPLPRPPDRPVATTCPGCRFPSSPFFSYPSNAGLGRFGCGVFRGGAPGPIEAAGPGRVYPGKLASLPRGLRFFLITKSGPALVRKSSPVHLLRARTGLTTTKHPVQPDSLEGCS